MRTKYSEKIIRNQDLSSSRRPQYIFVFIALIILFFLTRSFAWQGSVNFHTLIESIATVIAIFVGIMALIRYYTKKDSIFLLIGSGFLATALLDGYHTIATSGLFINWFPSSPEELIPWSWLISRLVLSILMFASWYLWLREKYNHKVSELSVYLSVSAFTLLSFIFFAIAALPQAYFPEASFSRPFELLPALFLLIALIGYLKKGEWKNNIFEHWLIYSLIIGFMAQIAFMSLSLNLFDAQFDLAHILKIVSYICVLVGLLGGTFKLFHEAQSTKIILAKQNETLLRAKVKDESILASIGDGLVFISPRREIILLNKSGEKIVGHSSKQIIGKTWPNIVEPTTEQNEPVPSKNLPCEIVLSTSKRVAISPTNHTYYFKHKDGSRFPVAITASSVVVDGEKIGAIVVFRDITEEKAIDRAKTEFVSLASHQLRTPLSTINWYAEMLLDGDAGKLSKNQKEFLDEIYKGNQRLVSLVNALLNVSRLELGTFCADPEKTDLVSNMKETLNDLGFQIKEKKLKIQEIYDQKIPIVTVDPKLINIIFQNIVSNAIKYSRNDGEIKIGMKFQKRNAKFNHTPLKKQSVLISVTDQGYGIPKSAQNKIFTKLYRADNVKELDTDGNGLGLYIVKSIIDHADGMITFKSKEGIGTTFYVCLPTSGMKHKSRARGLYKG